MPVPPCTWVGHVICFGQQIMVKVMGMCSKLETQEVCSFCSHSLRPRDEML